MLRLENYADFADYFFPGSILWEPIRSPRLSSRNRVEWVDEDLAPEASITNPLFTPLFGQVMFVPNKTLKIDDDNTRDHPCVCVHANDCIVQLPKDHVWAQRLNRVPFCIGTDARNIRPKGRGRYLIVPPSDANRLTKITGFRLSPFWVRSRDACSFHQKRVGTFSEHEARMLKSRVCQQEIEEQVLEYPGEGV